MLLTFCGRVSSGFWRSPKLQAPPTPTPPQDHAWSTVSAPQTSPAAPFPLLLFACYPQGRGEGEERGSRRERRTGDTGGRITHADAGSRAGVRSAIAEEAAALLARLQQGAALAALAGAHQTAGTVVQHRSHPGGAGWRRLGTPGRTLGGTALGGSDLARAGQERQSSQQGRSKAERPGPRARAALEGKVTRGTGGVRRSPVPGHGAAGRPGQCTAWADSAHSA